MSASFFSLPVDPAVGVAVLSLIVAFCLSVFGLVRACRPSGERHVR